MKLIKGEVCSPIPLTPTPLTQCTPRPQPGTYAPPRLEHAIAARWKQWAGWVRLLQLRRRDSDPAVASAESARLRQRHSEHVLEMLRSGISMRTIRRHRLDDPRLTDGFHGVLVAAAKERQSKERFQRSEEERKQERLATLIRLGPVVTNAPAEDLTSETPETCSLTATVVPYSPAVKDAIQSIRWRVSEQFYLREMRDPELQVRTNRR